MDITTYIAGLSMNMAQTLSSTTAPCLTILKSGSSCHRASRGRRKADTSRRLRIMRKWTRHSYGPTLRAYTESIRVTLKRTTKTY